MATEDEVRRVRCDRCGKTEKCKPKYGFGYSDWEYPTAWGWISRRSGKSRDMCPRCLEDAMDWVEKTATV